MRSFILAALALAMACRSSDGGARGGQSEAAAAQPPAQTAAQPGDTARINALLERADAGRIQGSRNAPVWLVEISDFQCPYCKQWHDETYPVIKREFIDPGHVRMAYVNLPLSIHVHAVPAAEAAMCAAAQDRFWPVHDAIFDSQERWAPLRDAAAVFDSLAVRAGVDSAAFRECVRSGIMRRVLNGDRQRATSAGVTSTPTFFVGDEAIRGAAPVEEFRAAIARARAKASPR